MSLLALCSRVAIAAILLVGVAPVAAQHEEVQSLASRLAGEISKGGRKRVAVANFAGPGEGFTQLGKILSLEFAASLAWSGSGLDVIHSPALAVALREAGPAPKNMDLFDDRVVKRFGQLAGAEVIVTGILGLAGDHVEFSVRAAKAATGTTIAQATGNLPLTPVVKELLAIRLFPFATPPPTGTAPPRPAGSGAPTTSAFHDGAYDAGKGGITYPECTFCPDPSYTDKARAKKISGGVMLNLIVSADGQTSQIKVLQGLGYGLDEQAVRAVSNWKFKPAHGPDGQPVPVWVKVEVTFRIL